MVYPGGKNGSGVFQRIINYMPPHEVYVEGFLGSGAILRNKRPAEHNIAIDKSSEAISLCIDLAGAAATNYRFLEGCALEILPSLKLMVTDRELLKDPQTLLYLDPPYVMDSRKGGELYEFEMSDEDHLRLLEILTEARCMVMLSGYQTAMYDDALSHWNRVDYQTQTRRGMVDECLWMNFKPPKSLHDYSFLGSNFRERERIKRKKERWKNKLAQMDRLERLALMEAIESL